MFGFSIFLGSPLTDKTINYIDQLHQHGFTGIFTSMHIPEDDASQYKARITTLGKLAKERNLKLMVDISTKGLSTLGLDLISDAKKIKELGITGLRMDYGISMKTIAEASHSLTIGLNASTLSEHDMRELQDYGTNFDHVEYWHNYYPRAETGLDRESFIEKNKWLKQFGGTIVAFTPGDKKLRGPIHAHLPTLEEHRYMHPLAASIDLFTECYVDAVYIGDEMIHKTTLQQCSLYQSEGIIQLQTILFSEYHNELILGNHLNRMDSARDVIRCQEARFKSFDTIEPFNTTTRQLGSITLDNALYGRYMGEFQLTKTDLPADSRVNVMGQVIPQDISLLPWITAGTPYQLIRREEM